MRETLTGITVTYPYMNTDMWNVHRMFITHIYNIGIPKHEKHDFLVQVRNFFITFEFKGFST